MLNEKQQWGCSTLLLHKGPSYLSSALIERMCCSGPAAKKGGCEHFVWTLALDRRSLRQVSVFVDTGKQYTIMNSPMKGRLGNDTMKALGVDDVTAAEKWLYDDQTHIEDTEVIFLATHSD
jgi:hypothetical protein